MKFHIYAREIHIQCYTVEADTVTDAVDKWEGGEGELGRMEYSHIDGYTHIQDDDGNIICGADELSDDD